MKKVISVFMFIIILFGSMCVYATDEPNTNQQPEIKTAQEQSKVVKAKVLEAGDVYEEPHEQYAEILQKIKFEVLEGKFKGKELESTYTLSYDMNNKILAYPLSKGNSVFVEITSIDSEISKIVVQDVVRENHIIYMVILFFALILVIGRKQGLKAILGLLITVIAIWYVMVSSIYEGNSPIVMSIVTCFIIIIFTFIVIAGINKKSATAAIGTIGGVTLAGIISSIFGVLTKLSGGQEEAILLSENAPNIAFNFRELLFAGIVIAALGACMDVGMSIASALDELKQKNPDMTWKELFKSGMNIGGDVIGTMTNTLILAYVGGALTTILLFMASNMSLTEIINKEIICSEIVSALSGSMGVICKYFFFY